jgi:hypothetical protein
MGGLIAGLITLLATLFIPDTHRVVVDTHPNRTKAENIEVNKSCYAYSLSGNRHTQGELWNQCLVSNGYRIVTVED